MVVCLRWLYRQIRSFVSYKSRESWVFYSIAMQSMMYANNWVYYGLKFICTLHSLSSSWSVSPVYSVECMSKNKSILAITIIHYMVLNTFILPIFLLMIVRMCVLFLIILFIFKISTIRHCLRLYHEIKVYALCLVIFLWKCDIAGLLHGPFSVLVFFAPNLVSCHWHVALLPC